MIDLTTPEGRAEARAAVVESSMATLAYDALLDRYERLLDRVLPAANALADEIGTACPIPGHDGDGNNC